MRLAYEQGLLQGRSISPYQRWGLEYMMSFKRWFIAEVQESALKSLLFLLDPKRYSKVYFPKPVFDEDEEGLPINPEDYDAMESFIRDMEQKRSISGDRVAQGPEDGWV